MRETKPLVCETFFSIVISIIVIQTVGVVHGKYIIIKKFTHHKPEEIYTTAGHEKDELTYLSLLEVLSPANKTQKILRLEQIIFKNF